MDKAVIEAEKNKEKLQLQVKEAARDVIQHCQSKKMEVEKLIDKFDKKIGLRWDSKVPQCDKRWYYFFTLKAVDAEKVIAEIQEFLTLYEGIEELQDIEGTEDYDRAHKKVDELLEKLKIMCQSSRDKQYTSDSSTVCKLYENLDSEGGTLKLKLQSVNYAIGRKETAAFKLQVEQLKELNAGLSQSAKNLQTQLEESTKQLDSLSKKHDELMDILMYLHPNLAEMMRNRSGQGANIQRADRQQGTHTSNTQSSRQQQKPNAQTASDQQGAQASDSKFDQQQNQADNDSDVQSISRSRSSSLSSSSSSNNNGGPSSELKGIHSISRSQSLSSDDSDIVIISKPQCR